MRSHSQTETLRNETPRASASSVCSRPRRLRAARSRLPANAKLRWMDSGDQKAYFFKPFFAAYHKKNPGVTVNYDGSSWSQIQQVITLGIRNGSAPDVFQLPPQITIPNAVANGWIG